MNLNHKKNILRKIPNGLFIVTTKDKVSATGATLSFLTQVSIEPSLIALAIRKDSKFYTAATNSEYLAVHLPGKEQKEIVASFFKIKEQSIDSINGYKFEWSKLENPILIDVPMIIEVKIKELVEIGDHPVFICEVINLIQRSDEEMLTMSDTNWHYGG